MATSSFYFGTAVPPGSQGATPSSFFSGMVDENNVTRRQYFEAVSRLANMNTLYQEVSADPNNSAWNEFWSATFVQKGGALVNLSQSVFSWSTADIDRVFTLARSLPL